MKIKNEILQKLNHNIDIIKEKEVENYFMEKIIKSKSRVQKHGEVFTPKKIVEEMLDVTEVQEVYKNLAATFLEPSAGEGIFLITLLERRLKILSKKYSDNLQQYEKNSLVALATLYGIELLEDNVKKCLSNLYEKYCEYYQKQTNRHKREMNQKVLENAKKIISENIKLGNFLTKRAHNNQPISFKSWRLSLSHKNTNNLELTSTTHILEDEKTKFDMIIGNPPFSKETKNTSDNPIYHLFMDESYQLADKVMFITPARFLFNAGKTPKSWNRKMLNDPHLKVVFYEQKGSNIFNNTSITGGVAVTYRDQNRDFGAIEVFTIYPELDSIMKKVKQNEKFEPFSNLIYSAFSYKFTQELYNDYPKIETMTKFNNRGEQVPLISKGHKYDLATNILESLDFVVHSTKPQDNENYIKIYGRVKRERVYRYIKRKYIKDNGNLDFYKVFVPKANGASGQIVSNVASRIIGAPILAGEGVAHTNTFISIGKFGTESEARAVEKYVRTKFARVLLGVLKVTQDNQVATWSKIPMQDFTSSSDIDWDKSIPEIDKQLYEKYNLSKNEIKFIETHIALLK